jgi:predicted DNA-binding WGR domain protein
MSVPIRTLSSKSSLKDRGQEMPYFEFIGEDKSRKSEHAEKFWEVTQDGSTVTVRFGKLGTDGQTKVKDLGSPAEAEAEVAKLIKEKTKKGYIEK